MRCSGRPTGALAGLAVAFAVAAGSYAGQANAAMAPASSATPTDAGSLGSVQLYDAVGNLVSHGSDLTHIADFAQASSAQRGESTSAIAFALTANEGSASSSWAVSAVTPATSYPTSSLGVSLSSPTTPTTSLGSLGGDVSSFLTSQSASAPSIVEIRLFAGDHSGIDTSRYWESMLQVDPGAGTWAMLAPAALLAPQLVKPDLVTLRALDVSQAPGQQPVVSSVVTGSAGNHPAGTVELFDSNHDLGEASYNPATGSVTAPLSHLDTSSQHRYRFQFTPANPSGSQAASSPELLVSSAGEIVTVVSRLVLLVSPPPGNSAYGPTSVTAFVTPAGVLGSVQFADSVGGTLGTVSLHDGSARLVTNSLGAGTHTVSAKFLPAKNECVRSATAIAPAFTLTGSTASADNQAATVNLAAGQLTITTPYTPSHPFDLGSLVLTPSGARLFASAHFGTAATAALKGINVTDTRPGDQSWTASVNATSFLSGQNAISAQNIGFINVHSLPVADGALGTSAKPVVTRDLPASEDVSSAFAPGSKGLAGLAKTFALAPHGAGSVYLYGDLILNAPTTTPVGKYSTTLTFTVG